MANMREIRNRMKSIQDTMKITKAMYVVSSSKLKKAQKQYDRTKPYYKALSIQWQILWSILSQKLLIST